MKISALAVCAVVSCAQLTAVAGAQSLDTTSQATAGLENAARPDPQPPASGFILPRLFPATTILAPPDAMAVTSSPVAGALFRTVAGDVKGFFNRDTAKLLTVFVIAGASASHWDGATVEDVHERMPSRVYQVGNVGGSLAVQAGAGAATYLIGRMTDRPALASIGGDIVRAQVVSQLFVQAAKLAAERPRPDGSDSFSFPSGHSASAFATATVLQQHLGWKAGIPAYAFASFVSASRMGADKHYLSDVLVGAGIGIAAGRTVTLHVRGEQFALGAAPTHGGAMLTFTKH